MDKVNHKMVQLARESRGYTQTELAERMKIQQGNLSRMENASVGISEDHLLSLAHILNYPVDFFYMNKQIVTSDAHYRKRVLIDQKSKLKAEALMNIYKFHVEEMLKVIEIPTNIPIVADQFSSAEKIAQYVRSFWKIPRGPIENLSKIIEDNGIIVIQVDFETDKIDGRTIVTDTGHPIIFLNTNFPGDRQRMTLSHELGHVIMHINGIPTFDRDEEDEAFDFGSEFMMPHSDCEYDLSEKLTLEKLADLKRIWRISMQAILYRAQRKQFVTYNQARYVWSQIAAKGWKKVEPINVSKETPTLVSRIIKLLSNQVGISKEELAKTFRLTVPELEQRYFGPPGKLRVA